MVHFLIHFFVCIKWCAQNRYIKMKFDVLGCRLKIAEKAKINDNNNEVIKKNVT